MPALPAYAFWDIDIKLAIKKQRTQGKPLTAHLQLPKRNLDRETASGRKIVSQITTVYYKLVCDR